MGKTAEVLKIASNRVGRTLIPIRTLLGLLGRQDVHKPSAKWIEMVRILNVSVQGCRVKLRQQEYPVDIGVDAIANGNIDQPIFTRKRHGRFAAFHGKRVETCASASAHDDSDHIFWGWHNCRPKALLKVCGAS